MREPSSSGRHPDELSASDALAAGRAIADCAVSRAGKTISAIAFVPYALNTAPSQRYRLEQWALLLKEQGITVRFAPFANDRLTSLLYQRGRIIAKAVSLIGALFRASGMVCWVRRYDVVIVHRAISIVGPAVLERLASLFGRPIVFDFDDAIYRLHSSEVNRWFGWLKFPGKTGSICRMSSHVTVGNEFLAEFARQQNRNVTIIPSSIDTDRYQLRQRLHSKDPIVVGWTGSSTSQTYLEMFAPVLRQMIERRSFELRVVSDRQPHLPGVSFTWRKWSAQTEAEEVGEFDIGIMPMPDDEWSKGKCAFKALQYMAMGVPPICSAIGTNREVIEHGKNGYLAANAAEWLTHLEALIDSDELRNRLGLAARKTVEERYSMTYAANLFAQVIRSVTAGRPLSKDASALLTSGSRTSFE